MPSRNRCKIKCKEGFIGYKLVMVVFSMLIFECLAPSKNLWKTYEHNYAAESCNIGGLEKKTENVLITTLTNNACVYSCREDIRSETVYAVRLKAHPNKSMATARVADRGVATAEKKSRSKIPTAEGVLPSVGGSGAISYKVAVLL